MTGNTISTFKVTVLVVLFFLCLALGTAVLTMKFHVNQERIILKKLKRKLPKSSSQTDTPPPPATVQSTDPQRDIFSLQSQPQSVPPPHGYDTKTIGEAYWKQAASFLQDWDAILISSENGKESSHPHHYEKRDPLVPSMEDYYHQNNHYPHLALERAAEQGHPLAQYYLANAHASGIWPFYEEENSSATSTKLQVMEEWSQQEHPQVVKSFLLWHMAAVAGNIEAAMALAHRLDFKDNKDMASNSATCTRALPYYEAAAHGIIDQLEASPHSRAKVLSPMDRHVLAQVHMHGGTSSQLDWNNKPDESKEAIQFYHLKATTTPWNYNSKEEDRPTTIDVHAASTLGHLYHYGVRGVPQNLTLALQYYEIAANNGQWEAAGHAGTFYLWGMGTARNAEKALKYFKLGAPGSFAVCYRKRELAVLQKKGKSSEEGEVNECDYRALNGLGLIYLLGVPRVLEIDYTMAEKFLALAKESGDTDAHYNLAMMWLGWKTQFQNYPSEEDDLPENGTSSNPFEFPKEDEKTAFALHHSGRIPEKQFRGPSQSNIKEAIKLLGVAATRGHVQARHRLAMIYSEGIRVQTGALDTYTVVAKECAKAKSHFQWIIDNASVERSKRLRLAYKEYMAGNLETSLRNYLAAAEGGSNVGQVNSAFLLEQGVCLGLSPAECAKASVRLWKAAADRGNAEACLRVGDFYYYGRLRGTTRSLGPFGWMQYVLYPEKSVLPLLEQWRQRLMISWEQYQESGEWKAALTVEAADDGTMQCTADECPEDPEHEQELMDADLSMAAHYYTVAVDKHLSARANFNLGFMHEWGIGLKQDFPLAKRHYDLAASVHAAEANLAVQIALMAMSQHEYIVKMHNAWNAWWSGSDSKEEEVGKEDIPAVPKKPVGKPVSGRANPTSKKKMDVILSHVFDHSTLMICGLVFALLQVIEMRARRMQRR
jgi:TPR repeat protein